MWLRRLYSDSQLLEDVLPSAVATIQSFYETSTGQILIDFLILAEDHRNKYHIGVDVIAICRAIYRRLRFSVKEGASTIEQQLVRVVTGDYRDSISRKIKEIMLAVYIRKKV